MPQTCCTTQSRRRWTVEGDIPKRVLSPRKEAIFGVCASF